MPEGQQSKKPADTPFKQQRLPAWQPILSPPWVISCFFLVTAIFVPIGALIIVASGKVVEIEQQYDKDRTRPLVGASDPSMSARLVVPDKMESPVYMYYKLEGFFQNHRRYAKSRSDPQLAGDKVDLGALTDCKPFRYKGEVANAAEPKDLSEVYAPCGLIAWSMFNDTFDLYKAPDSTTNCSSNWTLCTKVNCVKEGIAWASDKEKKFQAPWRANPSTPSYFEAGSANPYYWNEEPKDGREGHLIPNQTDEDFMVWMRTASLPTFRKLYRRCEETLQKDTVLWVKINNRYDVSPFGGKKFVILSTTTWIGGKNYFLGTAYVVVGCLCFLLALVFVIKHLLGGRGGDTPAFNQ
eukprot:TRINITY_DN2656_c0_g1_i1.p2 TRINITY_DN2656_c0_g1~~TRINITY_DN2656_c0_g1_i1.p2  ORF type:complete len:353 (-),score=58.04 TRINITY_DN2656_c0_g1_i1:2171-3229(-)